MKINNKINPILIAALILTSTLSQAQMNADSTSTGSLVGTINPSNSNASINILSNKKTITSSFTIDMKPLLNPLCGASNGSILPDKPTIFLCDTGTASTVGSTSSGYNWLCSNNSKTVSCSAATRIIASCGSDNGKTLNNIPTNLCSAGSASAVVSTSSGYNWSCAGNYGNTASCSAQIQPPMPAICGYFQTTTLGYERNQVNYWGKCPTGHLGTEVIIRSLTGRVENPPRYQTYSRPDVVVIYGDRSGDIYGCPGDYTHKIVSYTYSSTTWACVKN